MIDIFKIVSDFNSERINVVEFGSGQSTRFLSETAVLLNKKILITSFDHHEHYSFKTSLDRVNVKIRELVQYSDADFENFFLLKMIDSSKGSKVSQRDILNTRLKNTFYNIKDSDIPDAIDLVISDGPNGNGRSLASIYIKNKLKIGSYIIIDDFFHYEFLKYFDKIFDFDIVSEFKSTNSPEIKPYHENKGSVIIKIMGIEK